MRWSNAFASDGSELDATERELYPAGSTCVAPARRLRLHDRLEKSSALDLKRATTADRPTERVPPPATVSMPWRRSFADLPSASRHPASARLLLDSPAWWLES
jgi:hypothetical protein